MSTGAGAEDTATSPAAATAPPAAAPPAAAGEIAATPAPWWSRAARRVAEANAAIVTVLAIFTALVVGAILIVVTNPAVLHAWSGVGSAPGHAFAVTGTTLGNAYGAIFTGSVISPSALGHAISSGRGWDGVFTPISETLVSATSLILAGLGVALGFSTGVFNIGAQGQLVAGALASLYVGFELHLPIGIHLPLVIVAGAVGGAVAGFIPGILKARTGAHEVIVTIMLNYVFLYLLDYLLSVQPFQQPHQSNSISRQMPATARMPHLFGSGLRVNVAILVALAVAGAVAWFMRRSTLGFSFRVIGSNQRAGRTAGMSVSKVTVLVLTFSGALAGLAGMASLSGTDFFLSSGYGGNIGFDAITVALLGRNRPMGVVLGSLLFAALDVGGANMQVSTGIPIDLSKVIQATIVFFVATPLVVRQIYRLRSSGAGAVQLFTKGWSG